MAYPERPDSPRTRPSTVKLAVILLYAAAVAQLINVILNLVYFGAIREGAERATEAVRGTSLGNQMASQTAGQIGGIVVGVLLAVMFAVLAALVGRGSRVGRILTWVFGGIALCCLGGAYSLTLLGRAGFEQARKNEPDLPTWTEYNDLLMSGLPSWYSPVTIIIGILGALAVLGAVIALTLPSSHLYFRKRDEPRWEPPLPPAAQP